MRHRDPRAIRGNPPISQSIIPTRLPGTGASKRPAAAVLQWRGDAIVVVDDCGAWCGAEQSCVLYVAVGISLAVDSI